jgi:hypothetical protein
MREIRQSGSEGGVAGNGHPYPYLGGHRAAARSPTTNSALPTHRRARAISPKAPMSAEMNRSEAPKYGEPDRRELRADRSEIGPYLGGSSGCSPESYYKLSLTHAPPS